MALTVVSDEEDENELEDEDREPIDGDAVDDREVDDDEDEEEGQDEYERDGFIVDDLEEDEDQEEEEERVDSDEESIHILNILLAISLLPRCFAVEADTDQTALIFVNASAASQRPIPETLFGIFFEEINRAGAGGIWAELVSNRGQYGSIHYSTFQEL